MDRRNGAEGSSSAAVKHLEAFVCSLALHTAPLARSMCSYSTDPNRVLLSVHHPRLFASDEAQAALLVCGRETSNASDPQEPCPLIIRRELYFLLTYFRGAYCYSYLLLFCFFLFFLFLQPSFLFLFSRLSFSNPNVNLQGGGFISPTVA